jgi:hypothetical protein
MTQVTVCRQIYSILTLTIPSTPTNLSVVPDRLQLNIYFTQDSGFPISNYQYSLNGGDFIDLNPPQTQSPVILVHPIVKVRSKNNQIRLKAVNTIGTSEPSEIVLGSVPCLLKGMKIKMSTGEYKNIEEIKDGDYIMDSDIYLSYNHAYFYKGWKLSNKTRGLTRDESFINKKITYYHIVLPDYPNDKLLCNDLPVDSYDYDYNNLEE